MQTNTAQVGTCFLKIPDNSTLLPEPSLVWYLVDASCRKWVPACPEALSSYRQCQIHIVQGLRSLFGFFAAHGRDLLFFQELP